MRLRLRKGYTLPPDGEQPLTPEPHQWTEIGKLNYFITHIKRGEKRAERGRKQGKTQK